MMNKPLNRAHQKAAAFLLVIALLLGNAGMAGWNVDRAFAASPDQISAAVSETLTNYYGLKKNHLIENWEELLAVKASGGDLVDYELPSTDAGTTSTSLMVSLIKGDMTTAGIKAAGLVSGGALIGESDAYKYALNIIAIEAYNRSTGAEIKSYSTIGAINSLLAFRHNNIFLDPYNDEPGGDMVGMALVALSLFSGDQGTVDAAIDAAENQIRNAQTSSGAFAGAWGKGSTDANTTSVIIWGLIASSPGSISSYTTGGAANSPVDGLLSYYVSDGGYGYSNNLSVDAYATKQASLAMADVKNGYSSLATLSSSSIHYISTQTQVIDAAGNYYQKNLTLGPDKSYAKAIQEGMATTSAIDIADYNIYVNGTLESTPTNVTDGDTILAISENFSKVAYFKTKDTDTLGVNKATASFKGSQELTLVVKTLSTGSSNVLTGKEVNYGNTLASNYGYTDSNGKITITPVEANTEYTIAAKYKVWNSYSQTMVDQITTDTAILPAVITMTNGAPQTATVSVRIEGPSSNILNMASFTVARPDGSRVTVYDAVTQALSQAGISYTASNKYISGIAGIAAKSYGTNLRYDGWAYNIIAPKYLNGEAYVSGMGTQILTGGEDIVVYYCNDDYSTVYPIVTSQLNIDGTVTIEINNYEYNYTTNVTSLVPTTNVAVYWGYTSGTALTYTAITDTNGVVTIPSIYATLGQHPLQISKGAVNLPGVIRLAPNYMIGVSSSGTSGGNQSQLIVDVAYLTVKGPYGYLKTSTPFTWYSGMTALQILQSSGLSLDIGGSGSYVKSIEGIGEFDLGKDSGWLYSVNGSTPSSTPSNSYNVAKNDRVLWYYTLDYTKDASSSSWTPTIAPTGLLTISGTVDSAGNVKASISTKELQDAVAAKGGMKITSDVASIKFDQAALSKISGTISSDLTVTMTKADTSKLSEADQLLVGSRPVYELSVKSGTKTISEFDGKVSVSIGYELAAGEDPNSILIYYINKDGNLELVKNSRYNETTKRVEFATDHFSAYAVGYHPVAFRDTKTHWAKDSINFLAARGIIKGMTSDTFLPGKTVSRAEFVTILANKAGVDLEAYQPTGQGFADVKASDWFAKAVAWASDQGVVNGSQNKVGSMKFDPNANITRQDMAVILSRYLSKVEKTALATPNAAVTFADQGKIAGYASFAVKNMQQAGIINGKTTTTFAPVDSATRAEAGKMIAEMMKVTF